MRFGKNTTLQRRCRTNFWEAGVGLQLQISKQIIKLREEP